jgi:hypothetical protein
MAPRRHDCHLSSHNADYRIKGRTGKQKDPGAGYAKGPSEVGIDFPIRDGRDSGVFDA